MTYSLAIHFFSHSLVYELYRALNNASHRRYWQNFGYGIRVKRKEKYLYISNVTTLQIIPRDKIPENNCLFKVTSTYYKVWLQILKSSILKVTVSCSNAGLFSLYYEPWHIRNPDTFMIRGIFRTLDYLKVRRYLDPCQTFCKVFGKTFQAIITFAERPF